MSAILDFLSSWQFGLFIAGVLVIAFAKSIISIFKMGVSFKSNLASKNDLKEFESEIRKDIRGYAVQIQKSVTDACMRVIDTKLKDVENVQENVAEIKIIKAELESEIKHALEKYDEIKVVGDTLRTLNNKVSRMEYKDSTANVARRTEK